MTKELNEISGKVAGEIGKAVALGAATTVGAATASALTGLATRKLRAKKFEDTVTGQDILKRLSNAKESLLKLKAQRNELSPKDFKKRAQKLEKRISKLKIQIEQMRREFAS